MGRLYIVIIMHFVQHMGRAPYEAAMLRVQIQQIRTIACLVLRSHRDCTQEVETDI